MGLLSTPAPRGSLFMKRYPSSSTAQQPSGLRWGCKPCLLAGTSMHARVYQQRVLQKAEVAESREDRATQQAEPLSSSSPSSGNNIMTHGLAVREQQASISEADAGYEASGSHAPAGQQDAHIHFMRPHEPNDQRSLAVDSTGDMAASRSERDQATAAQAHRTRAPPIPPAFNAETVLHEFHPKQNIHLPKPGAKPKPVMRLRVRKAAVCIALGLAVRWLAPIPTGIAPEAWTLLAVFCATIAGLVLEPLPVSAWSLCCVTTLLLTHAVDFKVAMSGLTNDAIWLIVVAFFFAKAFEKTGLGERLANVFVAAVGHSTLGLAYSLAAAEILMAPAMPSCTARAGGIFMPIIKFLAKNAGSEPIVGRKRLGAFLVHSQMQVSPNIAALFMTAAAQNLLAMNIARGMGVVIPDAWGTWALGAAVPGLISVVMIPWITFKLSPPEVRSTPEAPAAARKRLAEMGPLSRGEQFTLACLGAAVVMWMGGEALDIPAVQAAMIALSGLLVSGVLTWRDCLDYTPAWDTLVWFSVLVSMCNALAANGLVGRMADMVGSAMASANMSWMAAFGVLHGIFFWGHYIFASQVGHVGALYGAFLAMMIGAGVPAQLAALTLGYSSNLFGSITHFASGPAAVFYGSGFMTMQEVLVHGFLMAIRSWLVWGVAGMAWWKLLGWW